MFSGIECDQRDRVRKRITPVSSGVELFGSESAFVQAKERARITLAQGKSLLTELVPDQTVAMITGELEKSHTDRVISYRDGLVIPGRRIGNELPTIAHVSFLAGGPGGRSGEGTRLTIALVDAELLAVYFENGSRYPRYADITTVYEAIRDGVKEEDDDYISVQRLTINPQITKNANLCLMYESTYFDKATARNWVRSESLDQLRNFV